MPNSVIRVAGESLRFGDLQFRCAIGKGGFSEHKKEGDGTTPLGKFPLRECWYRADRLDAPQTTLPLNIIHDGDGWCDDPRAAEYNRHVKLPHAFSHETLWRDDHRYDLIVPLGYNDDPVVPGKGSAIFLHVAADDYTPTEGCVALVRDDLLKLLKLCDIGTVMEIREK